MLTHSLRSDMVVQYTHARSRCTAAILNVHILWNILVLKMNDEFIGVSLHISLHSKALHAMWENVLTDIVCRAMVLLCSLPSVYCRLFTFYYYRRLLF